MPASARPHVLPALLTALLLWVVPSASHAQPGRYPAETAAIMKADADFAAAVAQGNRERFLSFIAESTTFGGGTPGEVHGRDAVMKDWNDFFVPGGQRLTWTPTAGQVIGAGDVGYTTGTSLLRGKRPDGTTVERRGEYLTVWMKQEDGSWRVVFDTGSTLPAAAVR